MKIFVILGIVILLFSNSFTVLASFHSESVENKKVESVENKKEWTYMKYITADHSFSAPSLWRLKNYAKSNEHLNIVILQDTSKGPGKIWQINNRGRAKLLKDLGEVEMDNPSTLSNFINYSKKNFLAERYFLDIESFHKSRFRHARSFSIFPYRSFVPFHSIELIII